MVCVIGASLRCNLEARKPRSGPDEDGLGYVIVCLVRENRNIYYLYGNNEVKPYIVVETTTRVALVGGTTDCMLYSLPSVYQWL